MMHNRSLAMRYAKALFGLAAAQSKERLIEEQLAAFSGALQKDRKLQTFFAHPVVTLDKKVQVLTAKTLEIDSLVRHFLIVLAKKRRFELLPEMVEAFHELLNQSAHFEEVLITTALPLKRESQIKLEKLLEKKLGEKIISKTAVNASLIGGITLEIRNRLYDGSLRAKLRLLKLAMSGN